MGARERAVKDQIEAEARDILERSLAPASQAEIDRTVAETWRQMGLPVISARGQRVDNTLSFELKVARPKAEG